MILDRRTLIAALPALSGTMALPAVGQPSSEVPDLQGVLDDAGALPQLRSIIVGRAGTVIAERVYAGPALDEPVNVKSASKTILSALLGACVARDEITLDLTLGDAIPDRIPRAADDAIKAITVRDLVSMQAGLQSTSGRAYGPWVVSGDWVDYALSRPLVAEPGGRMIYSTGTSHLLGVVLAEVTGTSLLALARDRLGAPLGFEVPPWTRDPQGAFMGGNEMALSPRALFAFGELYRNDGTYGDQEVLPASWIEESFEQRGRSRWSGRGYGYGWWLSRVGFAGRHRVAFAWGYGGQMIYVVPGLDLTAVMTSDPNARGVDGHVQALHRLFADRIVPLV